MKKSFVTHSLFALALLATTVCAQNPPPPPAGASPVQPPAPGAPAPPPPGAAPVTPRTPAAAPVTETGSVRYIIYGPQGEVQALILRNDKIVTLAPELGPQIRLTLTQGTAVSLTGVPQYFGRQRQVMAQSLQVNGQNFTSAVPAPAGAAPQQAPPPGAAPPTQAGAQQPTPPPPPPQ